MFVCIRSESNLFTVGHYRPADNQWIAESDYGLAEEAAARCRFLNGGSEAIPPRDSEAGVLRDYFAGQALVGLVNLAGRNVSGETALAYRYADAMMLARREDTPHGDL